MDVERQKLLLLAMRINNTNQLKIQISPIKVVNVEFFASVIDLHLSKYIDLKRS